MGYAVHVDPQALGEAAHRLAAAAETLDTLARRVPALCSAAGAVLGSFEVGPTLDDTGRETARAVGRGAAALADLAARTGSASQGYGLLERGLAGRWAPADGPARVAGGAGGAR